MSRVESITKPAAMTVSTPEARVAMLEAQLKEAIVEIAELRARDALKTQFLATISHDLRTPLTAVITHGEILRDGILGDLSPRQMESVRGINLSGGQKQRAALARALARRPTVVLLDDALSAVDTHTEAEILRSLREALTRRTALIASHRVSAIRDATWIIVLDEGETIEQGRHEELLARRGRYWRLLRRQQLEASIESDEEASDVADDDALATHETGD